MKGTKFSKTFPIRRKIVEFPDYIKNVSICINDTDKNPGACNADKVDVIKECDRQLQNGIGKFDKRNPNPIKRNCREI